MDPARKPPRAVSYLRCSTSSQDFGNQRPAIEQLAAQRGYEIIAVYSEAVSSVKQRPQFDRMMRDAARGEFDVVIVWDLSRFHRDMHRCLIDVAELDRLNVKLISVRETWLDTSAPTRHLILAIVSWLNEQSREAIVERTRAGLARARARGVRLGRPPISIDTNKLIALHESGLSVRKVARAMGIGASTAHRLIQAHLALKAASAACPANPCLSRVA